MAVVKKLFLTALVFLVLLVISSLVYTKFMTSQGSLVFSSNACSDDEADPLNPETMGVKSMTWGEDGTLNIKAYVGTNCADKILAGRYLHIASTLLLSYYVDNPKIYQALCTCAQEINYKITGLPKKNYQIELENKSNLLLTLGSSIFKLIGQ